jgi:hypothetical protein
VDYDGAKIVFDVEGAPETAETEAPVELDA